MSAPASTAPVSSAPASAAHPWRARALWIGLCAAAVASRLAVAPGVLYDWDAANYAHAMREFNVALHQPHPPGYLLYVLLLRALSVLPGDVTPFIALNALFTGAVLLLVGRLARRRGSAALGWLCALAFAVCPQFWHQGAVTTIYVTECLCSVLLANVAFDLSDGRLGAERAALWFGVAVALRPSGALTLGPLVVVAALLARPPMRALARAVGLFSLTTAAWLVPTVMLSGGWSRYRAASAALGSWQLDLGSVFGGAGLMQVLPRLRRLVMFVVDGTNVLLLILAASALVVGVAWLRRRRAQPTPDLGARRAARLDALLVGAWVLPAAVVYGLHHLPKSGYVLTILPAIYVVTAWLTHAAVWPRGAPGDGPRGRPRRAIGIIAGALLALFVAINVYGFMRAVPHELLTYRDARIRLPDTVLLSGDYGVYALRYRTYALRRLRRIMATMKRGDVMVFLMGAHELHRLATYYCASCWLVATSVDHGSYTCQNAGCEQRVDFGAFQNRVLHRPQRRTWGERTRIAANHTGLYLTRAGRALHVGLRGAKRLIVVAACPPCGIDVGPGVTPPTPLRLGARYRAWTLALKTSRPARSGRRAAPPTGPRAAPDRRTSTARARGGR